MSEVATEVINLRQLKPIEQPASDRFERRIQRKLIRGEKFAPLTTAVGLPARYRGGTRLGSARIAAARAFAPQGPR